MQKFSLIFLAILGIGLTACNSGTAGAGGSDYPTVTANSLDAINGESNGLAVTLQSSLSQIQPMGGSNNFCYTIGTNNILYYYNAPCSPTVVQNSFIELNLIQFLSNPNDIPVNTATDRNNNIYIQVLDSVTDQYYLLRCNVVHNNCTNITLPNNAYNPYPINFIIDNLGQLHTLSLYPLWGGNGIFPWVSSDGGNTWQMESFNLGTGYVQPKFNGLLFDPNTQQVISQFNYINHFGNQSELVGLVVGSNTWQPVANFPYGYPLFSQTGYQYSVSGNYGDWDGGLGVHYYANSQDNVFVVNAPTGINLNGATVYSSAFDQQNNLYITFNTGVTIYVKAPM